MYSLIILNEMLTNGYKDEILNFFSLASIFCGIFVIISKNPIVSVIFLIGLFLSIASYLIILGISFIGLSYLLVYVGAVSILFIFILMLINIRISELISDTSNSIPLAIIIAICYNYTISEILPYNLPSNYIINLKNAYYDAFFHNNNKDQYYISKFFNFKSGNGEITYITSKAWDSNLAENSHITSIGNILYTSYCIWLIITSILLLLAMVGAIVITIKQKN